MQRTSKINNTNDSVQGCLQGNENWPYVERTPSKEIEDKVFGLSTHVLNSKNGNVFFSNSPVSTLMKIEKSKEYGLSEDDIICQRKKSEIEEILKKAGFTIQPSKFESLWIKARSYELELSRDTYLNSTVSIRSIIKALKDLYIDS